MLGIFHFKIVLFSQPFGSLFPGGGVTRGFQVIGMVKGFFGFEISIVSGLWGGRKIVKNYFVLSRDDFGYSKQSEDLWLCLCCIVVQIKYKQTCFSDDF